MILYNFWYDNAEYNEWREVFNDYYTSKEEALEVFQNFGLIHGQQKGIVEVDISVHPNLILSDIAYERNDSPLNENIEKGDLSEFLYVGPNDYPESTDRDYNDNIELLRKLKEQIENEK